MSDDLLEQWPKGGVASLLVVERRLVNGLVDGGTWEEERYISYGTQRFPVSDQAAHELIKSGLVTLSRERICYELSEAGIHRFHERSRQEEIAQLEAKLARLKGQK